MNIEKNPQLFIKKVLERILSKIPTDNLTDLQKTLKDHLASMLSPDVSLGRIQGFLRNMRNQFIPMLHGS